MKLFSDEHYILQTFGLAKKGIGRTSPNPMVGAVIVKNNIIIGEGYHKKLGADHAEIVALRNATQNPQGATLYINLEPCIHHGKTPPCTDAIIKAGINKVVCATFDPNPIVKQKGITKLRESGIEVIVGVLEQKARELNQQFFTFHEKQRPFVTIKFAASLDGKMTTSAGDSQWVTNDKARRHARILREKYQAVLVGSNTVLKDNPHLGTRIKNKKDPLRIILDSTLQIPLTAQVLRDTNVVLITTKKAPQEKIHTLRAKGITVAVLSTERTSIKQIVQELYNKNIISVLVEGGGEVIGSFIDSGCIDKAYIFYAPILIGGEKSGTVKGKGIARIKDALRLKNISYKHFDDNLLITGYINI